MAVGAFEPRVLVEHRLHVVVAGRKVAERLDRPAESVGVDDHRRVRREALEVDAVDRHAVTTHLQARLAFVVAGDGQEHATGERLAADRGRKRDLEA